jgi:hypothetical protein
VCRHLLLGDSPELGKALPGREVTIDRLSLVLQHGPEQLWDWRIAGTARMLGASR